MAIAYVGGQTAGRANPSAALSVDYALTGGLASVPASGDLVIVTAVTGSAAGNPAMAVTTPATWTALGQLNQSAVTADTSLNVSYKFMTATPDTAVTIPGTTNNAWAEAYTIQVFRGVDPTTPMDATAVSAGATGTGRPNPAAITPVTAGAWVVICAGGAAGTGATYTAPADFTTNFLTANGADTTDAMVGSGYWTGWTSGAVDPAVYTGGTTGANDSWASYTIALRPDTTDSTAPILTSQTVDTITTTGGVPKATTDEGNGTIYMVVVPNNDTPSGTQIKAGQQSSGAAAPASANQAVTGTGVQTFSAVSSLSSNTAYDCWFLHRDAAGNDSTAVKADFSTLFAFNDARQAIIDGLDSAQSEATGWDALRSSISVTAVVRTSSTVVTITLPALATYDITAQEVITATIPASALTGAAPLVATPTMTVNPVVVFYADRPRGSTRPFPFLPSTAQRR